MKSRKSSAAAILLIAISMLNGCGRKGYVTERGMIWNTTYNITFDGPEHLRDSIAKVLDEVGKSLSVFDPESTVSKVNEGNSVKVDSHFINVYSTSRDISRITGGMFDPTLSPIINAWGFGKGHTATADTLAIDSILIFTGIEKTRLNNGILEKDDIRTQFNFSAIAKGYGCDMVGAMFKRNGVSNYLVEIGGEIVAAGHRPGGGMWTISIDRPDSENGNTSHESQCIISLSESGLATSGNYRNFHRESGKIYGHTISPITGRPAQTDVLSVTVAAATAAEADAYATAFMAAGSEKAMRIGSRRGLPIMLVLADSSVWMSPPFKAMLKITE